MNAYYPYYLSLLKDFVEQNKGVRMFEKIRSKFIGIEYHSKLFMLLSLLNSLIPDHLRLQRQWPQTYVMQTVMNACTAKPDFDLNQMRITNKSTV